MGPEEIVSWNKPEDENLMRLSLQKGP